jgi:integrase
MGRRPQGWRLYPKRGWFYVAFTHAGVEHRIALGTRDPGEASKLAAKEYAEVVSGRRRAVRRSGRALLDLEGLIANWIDSLAGELDPETVKTCVIYGRTYLAFFGETDALTSERIGDFVKARLRMVLRKTMLKERTFLRRFLRWCVDQHALAHVPEFPELPAATSVGKRVGKQRVKPVEVTPAEARAILAALPETSKKIGKRKWPVRARFAFAWETALRPETIARLEVPRSWHRGARHLEIHDEDDKARFGRELPLSEEALRILANVAPAEGVIFGDHNFSKAFKRAAKAPPTTSDTGDCSSSSTRRATFRGRRSSAGTRSSAPPTSTCARRSGAGPRCFAALAVPRDFRTVSVPGEAGHG